MTYVEEERLITPALVMVVMDLEIEEKGGEGLNVLWRPLELSYLKQVVILCNTELTMKALCQGPHFARV